MSGALGNDVGNVGSDDAFENFDGRGKVSALVDRTLSVDVQY